MKNFDIYQRTLYIACMIAVFFFVSSAIVTIKTYAERVRPRNCASFQTQVEAQGYYASDTVAHKNLDTDNDGTACQTFNYKKK